MLFTLHVPGIGRNGVVSPPQMFSYCAAQLCLQVYLKLFKVWFSWLLAASFRLSCFIKDYIEKNYKG